MPSGYRDPDRRRRIAQAGLTVVAERGVEGLTHRAAAAAAGVPLGSTTYHFRTLDDLLLAAIVEAKDELDIALNEWADGLEPDPDLVGELTKLIVATTQTDRDRLMVSFELYVAAVRRPALQALSYEWDQLLQQVLARYTDDVTARALTMASDGILLQSLIRGAPMSEQEVEPLLRRVTS